MDSRDLLNVNVLVYAYREEAFDHDAYLAALAIESGSRWVATDRDFSRFPGLNWRHPLDG